MKRSTIIWIGLGAVLLPLQLAWYVVDATLSRNTIASDSMSPILKPGDQVLLRRTKRVALGDLVAYHRSDGNFIHRVVSTGGQTIEQRASRLFIDGVEMEEPYAVYLGPESGDFPPIKVPPGQFFLLGDNRDNSGDSRYNGAIETEQIIGRAFMGFSRKRGFWRIERTPPKAKQ